MSPEFEKQILVAGVGNAWMLDDAFGPQWHERQVLARVPPRARAAGRGLRSPVPRMAVEIGDQRL